MNYKTVTLIVIAFVLFSCKSSKFITTSEDYTKLNLDFSDNNISIIDERTLISLEEDIKIPTVSHPNQLYDYHPKLKQEYKEIITATIKENLGNASNTISTITVHIMEARKEFSATFSTEQELVSFTLKLVIDANGKKTEIIESGAFYRKSMDATYKKFEILFKKSLKEITYNALKKIKNQAEPNTVYSK